jgi:uncharacterized protein
VLTAIDTTESKASSAQVASASNEELAGPVTATAPAKLSERFSSIDVLRGVALLGILVLNIDYFGTVQLAHDIPVGTPTNDFAGPHAHLNLILFMIKWMFFEGKMRGLFSMLFGAGVILMTTRAELRGSKDSADIYTRRNMFLMFFGILHSIFIWNGDILFDYGFVALLFLYPLRKLKPKTLLWSGTLLSVFVAPLGVVHLLGAGQDLSLSRQAASIQASKKAGSLITAEQSDLLKQWNARVQSQSPTPAKTQTHLKEATSSYLQQVASNSEGLLDGFTPHLDLLMDVLSAMLIGMGLMKLGFFTGELPYASYWWTAILGFSISVPFYALGALKVYSSGFFFLDLEKWLFFPYYLTREPGSLAIAAFVMIIIKSGLFKIPQQLLAAVGRTAFSNYILTSLICQTLFVWGPWKLYGKLGYYQLMYVVFVVWTFNIVFSFLWLKMFAFGPLEFVWRSLTYGTMPPMRLGQKNNLGATLA